jgi:hypothetical protein
MIEDTRPCPPPLPSSTALPNPLDVIPRGAAQAALAEALDALARAQLRLESVAMACARALDGAA